MARKRAGLVFNPATALVYDWVALFFKHTAAYKDKALSFSEYTESIDSLRKTMNRWCSQDQCAKFEHLIDIIAGG